MQAFSLQNKTVLVTGATSGIGRQIVASIAEAGGDIVATGRNKEALDAIQKEFSKNISKIIVADLTQSNAIQELVAACPPLDGFVYSAGIVKSQPIRYLTREKLDETFNINFYAPVAIVSELDRGKKMNKNASFVFLSSIASLHPHKGATSYSASKSALESFVKVIALEYAHRGIRANTISPGMVQTPMYEQAKEMAINEAVLKHVEQYPLGIGSPNDVANAVIYLLSDASKWMTGTTITLDGGLLLGF